MSTTHNDYVKGKRLGVFAALRTVLEYLATQLDSIIDSATSLTAIVAKFQLSYSANVTEVRMTEVDITSAAIYGTSPGQLSSTNGLVLVAPVSGKVVELISAVVVYTYSGGTYSGGGDDMAIFENGGSAITGVIAKASCFGASASKNVLFKPLAAAGTVMTAGKGLNLKAATAFTHSDAAAVGTAKVRTYYRIHNV